MPHHDGRGQIVRHADAQRARLDALCRLPGLFTGMQQSARMWQETPTGFTQGHLAMTPCEQRRTDLRLQSTDLLADGSLRAVNAGRCRSEGSGLDDGKKGADESQVVDHRFSYVTGKKYSFFLIIAADHTGRTTKNDRQVH